MPGVSITSSLEAANMARHLFFALSFVLPALGMNVSPMVVICWSKMLLGGAGNVEGLKSEPQK